MNFRQRQRPQLQRQQRPKSRSSTAPTPLLAACPLILLLFISLSILSSQPSTPLFTLFPSTLAADASSNAAVGSNQQCQEDGTCSPDSAAATSNAAANDKEGVPDPSATDVNNDATIATDNDIQINNDGNKQERFGPNGDKLITIEELSTKNGKGGASPTNPIWLAVLGKVFDVTAGEDFYKFGGGGYSMFAGRDASPCFATGNFTVEGASEPIDHLDGKALKAILEWAEFYDNSDKYSYLGLLAGGIFYDDNGEETELRKSVMEKAVKAKEEADKLKAEKKKERDKRRAAIKKNKK